MRLLSQAVIGDYKGLLSPCITISRIYAAHAISGAEIIAVATAYFCMPFL